MNLTINIVRFYFSNQELRSSEEDIEKLAELAGFTGDFIRHKSYEAHTQAQEEAEKQQLQNQLKKSKTKFKICFFRSWRIEYVHCL